MPREYPRTRRVGEQLQRELAILIRESVRDPRIGMVSVSGVDVSRDLSHAKVYVSSFGTDEQNAHLVPVLQGAAGFLRRELSHRLRMRVVPQLNFKRDESLEYGAHLSALINSVCKPSDNEQDD